ncbi:Cupin superfamily protein [Aquimarina amphilecti]|uniref:Cupin superfamily protein n=1 Tax=Aquimarina amphilecti TaxID=1038014 RepID=A0A1H7T500_AQUAM|nr:cupin domain-containing protein [Aquimarina amphilecti]SEL79579.1 Cupin superfamily protein [Aquimarina amphilecti]
MNLQEILHPITTDTFLKEYFEKKHLIIKNRDRDFFNKLLSIQDLDSILFSLTNHHPDFRLADHSKNEKPDSKEYTIKDSDIIDPLKFSNAFENGSTLVMSGLQNKIYSLRKLTNELETFFKHRIQTNIYLTPKKSQGFSTHYDTHDVFIFQFEGSKHWRIYDQPVPLADKTTPFNKEEFIPGKVINEFTLEKGDVLYIPRGIVHDAYCTNQNSGHITTGIIGKTWAEHLAEVLLEKSKSMLPLRKFTKFHTIDENDKNNEILEVTKVVTALIKELQGDEEIIDDFYSRQKAIAQGQLSQIIHIDSINKDSKIKIREKSKFRMVTNCGKINVKFYDLKLSMPIQCKSFLSTLIKEDKALPIHKINCNLDDESKILVTKQLSKIGVLDIVS